MDVKTDVNDLYGYQLKLSWDKNILELTSATPHPENLWQNYYLIDNSITPGMYSLAYTAMSPTSVGFTGTATLATLNFKVKGTGQTKMSFSGMLMADSDINEIPFKTINGSFDNRKTGYTTTTIRTLRRVVGRTNLGITEFLSNPTVILVALIAIVVIAYGSFKFFARKNRL